MLDNTLTTDTMCFWGLSITTQQYNLHVELNRTDGNFSSNCYHHNVLLRTDHNYSTLQFACSTQKDRWQQLHADSTWRRTGNDNNNYWINSQGKGISMKRCWRICFTFGTLWMKRLTTAILHMVTEINYHVYHRPSQGKGISNKRWHLSQGGYQIWMSDVELMTAELMRIWAGWVMCYEILFVDFMHWMSDVELMTGKPTWTAQSETITCRFMWLSEKHTGWLQKQGLMLNDYKILQCRMNVERFCVACWRCRCSRQEASNWFFWRRDIRRNYSPGNCKKT